MGHSEASLCQRDGEGTGSAAYLEYRANSLQVALGLTPSERPVDGCTPDVLLLAGGLRIPPLSFALEFTFHLGIRSAGNDSWGRYRGQITGTSRIASR